MTMKLSDEQIKIFFAKAKEYLGHPPPIRGGGYSGYEGAQRCAMRAWFRQDISSDDLGLRLRLKSTGDKNEHK